MSSNEHATQRDAAEINILYKFKGSDMNIVHGTSSACHFYNRF